MANKVKVKMLSNLGWLDAQTYGICDATLEGAREDAEIEVAENEASILVARLKCAEVVVEPRRVKETATAGK